MVKEWAISKNCYRAGELLSQQMNKRRRLGRNRGALTPPCETKKLEKLDAVKDEKWLETGKIRHQRPYAVSPIYNNNNVKISP